MFALVLTLSALAQSPGPLLAPPNARPPSNDPKTTESTTFERVHLAGSIDLDVFSSEPKESSTIDCPTEKGPGLQLKVEGDTLMVTHLPKEQRTGSTCKLTLRVPTLTGIQISGKSTVRGGALTGLSDVKVSGAAKLDLRGIRSDSFTLEVKGAGTARLSGRVDAVSLTTAGDAAIDAKDLAAQTGTLASTGAGRITATLHQSATASAAGDAMILVYGQPDSLEQTISGSGRVERK